MLLVHDSNLSKDWSLQETQAGSAMTLSVKGVAAKLSVSQASFYERVRSGKIEHVRVGRRILISRGALEKFIEMNTRVGYYSG